MSWTERGIAVAMSLGGKAATIAQEIPVAILSLPQGLSILLRRLDADLGSELQDRVKESAKTFMRYRRPRGVSAAEHIVTFERLYADANAHGLYYSPVTLTMLLLESCQLTDSQEQWVMQCVAGDYSRYAEVRRALRRMPGLDARHGREASNWAVEEGETGEEREVREEEPWRESGTYAAEYDEGSETDESDDYCSTASDISEPTYMLLQQAWAIKRRRRFADKKSESLFLGGGKRGLGKEAKDTIPLTIAGITLMKYLKVGRKRSG